MALLLTTLSGLAYGATFPPNGHPGVAWVVLVPFFLTLEHRRAIPAAVLGFAWGIAASYGVGDWFPRAVAHYWDRSAAVGALAFFMTASLTGGIQYAAFAVAYRRLAHEPGVSAALIVGAAWVAAELARSVLFGGNPWALAGYSQSDVLPVIQIADLAGVFGVSFCIATVNAAVAQCWRGRWRGAAGAAGLMAAVIAYGTIRVATLPSPDDTRPVALVQGAVPVSAMWSPEHYGRNLESYLRRTADTLEREPADLVVWPESAFTFFLEQEPTYRTTIAEALRGRAELIAGGPRSDDPVHGPFRNAAFLLDDHAETIATYEKRRLVPFAEYFPLATTEVPHRSFGAVRAFVPGSTPGTLPTRVGRAGVLICNEAFIPALAASHVREGAALLLVLANDGWVGEARYAEIAAAMARFRAVEQRRDLLRCSTWGPSMHVDARGAVMARSGLGSAEVVRARVTPRAGATVYGWAGDLFAWGCVAAAVVGMRRQAT